MKVLIPHRYPSLIRKESSWVGHKFSGDRLTIGEHRLHYHRSHDVLPAYSRLYVECKDGLEFKIIVRRPTLQSRLECQVDIRIDGRYHELMVFAKNVKTFQHGMMTEMEDNIPYRRPFMFSTLVRLLPRRRSDGASHDLRMV